jgi:SAM-dependent methyltransferase
VVAGLTALINQLCNGRETMLASKVRNALGRAQGTGVVSRLCARLGRGEVSENNQESQRLPQRIKRQRRRIHAQQGQIEVQARRIKAQAQRLDAYERQFERVTQLLSEKDLQGALWEAGKSYEVRWWRHWLRKNCRRETEEYKGRLDPDQPLQERITQHLRAPLGATVSILDVGAGPLTRLGKRWEGRAVQITAVDPLADDYNSLLDELGLTPPVRTQYGEVERLTEQFPKNSFDLVNIENALDHSYDPLLGIRQMLEVVRSGSSVVLYHYINEGNRGDYVGFHQWNFCAEEGHFIIWNPQNRVSVNDALGDIAEITVEIVSEEEAYFASEPHTEQEKLLVSLRKR